MRATPAVCRWIRITTPQYRSRIFALKFVVSFTVAGVAIPLVAYLHAATGFEGLLIAMGVVAGVICLCVLALPRTGVTGSPLPGAAH